MWQDIRKNIRVIFLFGLGAGGFIHEVLITETERPFVLTASLTLMGLELVLRADEKLRRK